MRRLTRDSDIQALSDKVLKQNYDKYLRSVSLRHVRGFVEDTINFDFPVTAIVGPNGGGKTTVLCSAGAVYKELKPSDFFVKSPFDSTMENIAFEYRLVDKKLNKADLVKRTVKFKSARWSREAVERRVFYFGVQRTVPATERKELYQLRSPSASIDVTSKAAESPEVVRYTAQILGISETEYSSVKLTRQRKVFSNKAHGTEYSEFHFGAGQSSILRIVSALEASTSNSLVLIEEIENGLHPLAVKGLVDYLLAWSVRTNGQVIFTTHSEYSLEYLPHNGIWASVDFKLQQGRLSILSLRAISGEIGEQDVIFVEDKFAKSWIYAMFIHSNRKDLSFRFQIYPVGGEGQVSKFTKNRIADPSIKTKTIGVFDGDMRQTDTTYFAWLPGNLSPEREVLETVVLNLEEFSGKLRVKIGEPIEDTLKTAIMKVRSLAAVDPHLVFEKLSEELGYIPLDRITGAFFDIYNEINKEEVAKFMTAIDDILTTSVIPQML